MPSSRARGPSLVAPVPDEARFTPLARSVLEALGIALPDAALPAGEVSAPFMLRHETGGGVRVSLSRRKQSADPYGGGPIDVRELRIDGPDGRARVALEEIAWVGTELQLHVHGMGEAGEAIARVVGEWLARTGRR